MDYDENPCPDLAGRLARLVKGMHEGVNPFATHLRYYCQNTDNKEAP